MTMGPKESRLRAILDTADTQLVQTAEQEWTRGGLLLDVVAAALENAAPQIGTQFGEQTGGAAERAFARVAAKVRMRSDQMRDAGQALAQARDAIVHAEGVRDSMGAPPAEPTRPLSSPGPSTRSDVDAERAYHTAKADYDAAFAKRERDSAAATDHMDRVYTSSTATMKKVHGEPDPAPSGPDSGRTAGGGSTGGSSSGGGTAGGGYDAPSGGYQTHATTVSHPGGPGIGHTYTPGHQVATPGTAQGGTSLPPELPDGSTPIGGVTTGAIANGTAPTAGGIAGAVGGGALGGLTGISGAVRGASPISTAGATAGRTIGSTARSATTGTLGRATGSSTGTTGTASSRGTTTSGTRGTGGSGSSRGAGSRGAAGGRGTAGAGSRAGRSRKDPTRKNPDFFDDEQDWVDDEDAAPGVLG